MMGTEEFKNLFRIRNGVETVPSLLQRKYHVDRMPVRGRFFFGCKIATLNFKKLFTFWKGAGHHAQNPVLAWKSSQGTDWNTREKYLISIPKRLCKIFKVLYVGSQRVLKTLLTITPYCNEKYRSGYKENQYELKGIYRQRMDQFFVYNDKRNCERVYEKICEMMKL